MSIRGENADVPLVQHSLRPISRISAKGAREGPGRNLHPDPAPGQPHDGVVVPADPRQTLRMGQNWHVPGCQNSKKELFHARRRNVVGRLDQDVARVGQRHEMPALQPRNEVGNDVVVRPRNELQPNALNVEDMLQPLHRLADLRTAVVVSAREDMRRARDVRHAIGDKRLRHRQRNRKIARAIVDTGQNMAMQIDHGREA